MTFYSRIPVHLIQGDAEPKKRGHAATTDELAGKRPCCGRGRTPSIIAGADVVPSSRLSQSATSSSSSDHSSSQSSLASTPSPRTSNLSPFVNRRAAQKVINSEQMQHQGVGTELASTDIVSLIGVWQALDSYWHYASALRPYADYVNAVEECHRQRE